MDKPDFIIDIIFLILAVLSIGLSLVVVLMRNPILSSIALVVSLLSVAAIYVLMYAPFVAAVQVFIYAGAILVLFTFVVLMIHIEKEKLRIDRVASVRVIAFLVVIGFLLVSLFSKLSFKEGAKPNPPEDFGSVKSIGNLIFGLPDKGLDNLQIISFELTSILIIVAIVGVLILEKKRK